jgi:hypothetical protein
MNRELLSRRYLFIYQMPKTGSQTVEATLERCQLPHQVYRFHFLSRQIASAMEHAIQTQQPTEAWKELARRQLESSEEIRRIIQLRRWLCLWPLKVPKLEVISSLRDPIGLSLSSIFENQAMLFPDLNSATVEACRAELLRPRALKDIQNWFDLEIKPILGIDVFAQPFPHAKGYAIYENRFARLLVYRYEGLHLLPVMLREFLQCNVPAVINRNIGNAKSYGPAYEEMKKQLRMPVDFVAAQCNSKMMRHFYSDTERRRILERWADDAARAGKEAVAA